MVHTKNESAIALAPQAWISQFAQGLIGNDAQAGLLAGLTFAAKDNIDVQGLPTTAACPAFSYAPSEHATVVQKLLDAGASLRGETNLDQFACGLNGTRSPYGAVRGFFDAHASDIIEPVRSILAGGRGYIASLAPK